MLVVFMLLDMLSLLAAVSDGKVGGATRVINLTLSESNGRSRRGAPVRVEFVLSWVSTLYRLVFREMFPQLVCNRVIFW